MEQATMKECGPSGGKKKQLRCPECGAVIAKAGKGTNAVFRCARCKADIDLNYTGPTLSMNVVFKES